MKNQTILIGNGRVKKELGRDLKDILKLDRSPLIRVEVKNDRIVNWNLVFNDNDKKIKLNKKLEQEIAEIAFYVGSLKIDEYNSDVELHVDKIKPYEVTGKVFKEQLTSAQQLTLGVKNLDEETMLEFSAAVETEWDVDICIPRLCNVTVFSPDDKLSVELEDCQYDATSIEESLQEFVGRYQEDVAALCYDRMSDND